MGGMQWGAPLLPGHPAQVFSWGCASYGRLGVSNLQGAAYTLPHTLLHAGALLLYALLLYAPPRPLLPP